MADQTHPMTPSLVEEVLKAIEEITAGKVQQKDLRAATPVIMELSSRIIDRSLRHGELPS